MKEEVLTVRARMQELHASGDILKAEWRISQLQILQRMISENHDAIRAALFSDLGKEWTEATTAEICAVEVEIELCIRKLRSWMKPWDVASPGISFPSRSKIVPMPLAPPGVLVIGPSNYPFFLCLHPAIGSLAAGNPTLLKPSDLCPATCELFQDLVQKYYGDQQNYSLQVVLADVPKTTELLSHPWGTIFFTGSARVGKIVATAAAQTLTPTILELGGKTPCVVDETCPNHIQQIAHRIIWAKLFNAGQTCAAVDYVLVHESVAPALIKCLQIALETQFPDSTELARLVCREHAQRQVELIQEIERRIAASSSASPSSPKIVVGGSATCDVQSRFVTPTMIVNPPDDSRLLKEEIFGPILPILTFQTRSQAIATIQEVSGMAPLCMYVFTKSDTVLQEYIRTCRAGGVVRNDCLVHLASQELPFGGLGTSGYGAYHGKFSFDAFSQQLPVVYRPCAPGMDLGMARYHPFAGGKGQRAAGIMKLPYIPVLKPAVVAVGLAIVARFLLRGQVAALLASALEGLAGWMRHKAAHPYQ